MTTPPISYQNNPQWYQPTWAELGFSSPGKASRRGQIVMKNKSTSEIVNATFSPQELKNTSEGWDPKRIYKISELKKFNRGTHGVNSWFNFEPSPKEFYELELAYPVNTFNNMTQYVLHPGLDFNSNRSLLNHQHVFAAYDGTITYVGYDNTSGHYVIVLHEFKGILFHTLYMHLSQPVGIKPGTRLRKKEWFANVGNTGSASACYSTHLHFEVRNNNSTLYYDPLSFRGINPLLINF